MIVQILRDRRYEVFHLTGIATTLTWTFLPLFSRLRPGERIIVSDHSTADTNLRKGIYLAAYYRAFKYLVQRHQDCIAAVITVSEVSKVLLCDRFGIDPSKVRVIPLGFDGDTFKFLPAAAGRELSSDAVRIGFAGKVDERKRLDVLIDACALVNQKTRVTCEIAGLAECSPVLRESLLQRAASRNLTCSSLPLMRPPELAEFYNSLDIAVFPGSISITTIEASGCGAPILLYRSVQGLEDRVAGDRGALFDSLDELVLRISEFILRNESTSSRAERARQTFADCSWSKIAPAYAQIYREVVIPPKKQRADK